MTVFLVFVIPYGINMLQAYAVIMIYRFVVIRII